MDLGLQDKIIIVTGGSKGIGYGISSVLAAEGAIPVMIGRNKADLRSAVARIAEGGGRAHSAIAELTVPEQCQRAVAEVKELHGRIDGLVNNAGVNDGIGLETGNVDHFIRSINRNLTHYYSMAHYVLPELKKTEGAIVNIGSKTSVTGQGGTSAYAAANGGRNAITREWAVELLPYGIRVNSVIVAECFTPLYEKWIATFEKPDEKLLGITQKIPLGKRMTSAEEIANMVVFLLSGKSSHTTGQLIYVDGGYTHLDRAIT